MQHKRRRIMTIVPVLVILALIALAYWYFEVRPAQANSGALTASGTIVITQVQIGTELSGRVLEVNVNEGDPVHAGDILARLDPALLEAQRLQAEAALAVAQAARDAALANQALLKAGPTGEQVQVAQAQLDQAEAGRQALDASLHAVTATSRPEAVRAAWERLRLARQEYYGLTVVLTTQQIEDVRTAMTTAQSNLAQAEALHDELEQASATPPAALDAASVAVADAQAMLEAATQAFDAVQDAGKPFHAQIEATRTSWDQAQLNLSQAKARYAALAADPDMTEEALDAAESTVSDVQTLSAEARAAYYALTGSNQAVRLNGAWAEAQGALLALNAMGRSGATTTVETLLNQLEAVTAQRDAASASLANLKNGARQEQLDAAQAQVDAAQAQVDSAQAALGILDVQIGKLTIVSPADGVVLTRVIQPGEIALPSATLLVLGLVDDKTITVYVPEERYGEISVGQEAAVSVDSFPGVSFKAVVITIADQAEFTPRNVQTVEGRKNTVFAIRLQIVEPDDRLKAGMPADVIFE